MERSRARLLVCVPVLAAIAACSGVDAYGTALPGGETSPRLQSDGGCSSDPPPPPTDPSTLPSCCSAGNAHCAPASAVAGYLAPRLAACAGGMCVPDPILRDPKYVPPKCASLNGAEGVCMSVCLPEVEQYASVLPQDKCAEGERCAPCISPADNKPTGACDLGKVTVCAPGASADGGAAKPKCPHQGPPVIDPSTRAACGTIPGAHCLEKDLVAEAQRSQLAPCVGGYCVPDDMIAGGGNFVPSACRSLNDAEGRCLHLALPSVAKEKDRLPVASCRGNERCVPCVDPMTLEDTGACRVACDVPREPARPFGKCCTPQGATAPQGKCLDTVLVPQSQRDRLDVYECNAATQVCVPEEMIPATFKGTRCRGTGTLNGDYEGVCLSSCLKWSFLDSLAVVRGTCDALHKCAPCIDPISKAPTGAPGCPP